MSSDNGRPMAVCCVVEQDTLSSALYWFNPGNVLTRPDTTEKVLTCVTCMMLICLILFTWFCLPRY